MDTARRSFFGFLLALPALAWSQSQDPFPSQSPRFPKRPDPISENPGPPPPKFDTREALRQNQKEIKGHVEKLFKLASDLRKEVENTDSSEFLSLDLVHKADEIAKLARQIKNLARG